MQSLFGMFGFPGHLELMILAGVILLLFGSARLPGMMRNIGSSVVEFRKGMKGIADGGGDDAEPAEKEENA